MATVATDVPPTRPRVLVMAHDIHWGGGMERVFAELIAGAQDRVDFEVVSSTLAPELRPLVRWHRVRVPEKPFPLKFSAYFLRAWLRARRIEADIVHTCGAIVPMNVDVASVHFCHRGYVAAVGGLVPPGPPMLRRINSGVARSLALLAERWSYRPEHVGRLACVSRGLEAEVQAAYPGTPTAVTPNGVDLERFRRDEAARDGLREELGVAPDVPVALFVGGDWTRKGVEIAIRAVARASSPDVRPHLWIVGSGDAGRFGAIAAEAGIADRVRFFGRRSDAERFYSAADVFLLPSQYEAFPLAAMEAAAAGLPVVAAPVHGAVEIVAAGGGIQAERTPEAFGRALAELAEDAPRRREMGRRARAFVEDLPWSRSVDTVVELYMSLDAPL